MRDPLPLPLDSHMFCCLIIKQSLVCKISVRFDLQNRNPRDPCAFQLMVYISSLQCYSVLSDIWVKNELCIPLESESSVLSTCNAFVYLSPPSKLKFAVLFCSIYKGLISFSAILF